MTAAFLAWIVEKKDPQFVKRLNGALHGDNYKAEMVKEWTGKDWAGLWEEYKGMMIR